MPLGPLDVPAVLTGKPTEALSATTYLHSAVDGDGDVSVACAVDGFASFSGRIASAARVLEISNGELTDNANGTARITVANATVLSYALASPAADCAVSVVTNARGPQIKAGSVWATFTCPSVEHAPADACAARGTFVLENCSR